MAETPTAKSSGSSAQTVVALRTVTNAVTNTTTLVTSATASFVAGDVGRVVTGSTDYGVFNYIASNDSGTNTRLAVAAVASNAGQTLTLTMEYVLCACNAAGVYGIEVDTTLMAAGDVVELRVYKVILTTGTPNVVYLARYSGAQPVDDRIKVSALIANELTDAFSVVFTIRQPFGTARALPWKVLQF